MRERGKEAGTRQAVRMPRTDVALPPLRVVRPRPVPAASACGEAPRSGVALWLPPRRVPSKYVAVPCRAPPCRSPCGAPRLVAPRAVPRVELENARRAARFTLSNTERSRCGVRVVGTPSSDMCVCSPGGRILPQTMEDRLPRDPRRIDAPCRAFWVRIRRPLAPESVPFVRGPCTSGYSALGANEIFFSCFPSFVSGLACF